MLSALFIKYKMEWGLKDMFTARIYNVLMNVHQYVPEGAEPRQIPLSESLILKYMAPREAKPTDIIKTAHGDITVQQMRELEARAVAAGESTKYRKMRE